MSATGLAAVPDERLAELAAAVRAIVDERALPLERDFLARGFAAVRAALDEERAEVRRRGLWAPQLPASLGGLGLPLARFARLAEPMGRSPLGHYLFNAQAPDAGNLELLHAHATPAQRTRWLEPLARGEVRSCFAMTEPEFAGSNPVWMGTTARLDGDTWILDGHKWFTTGADGAAFAVVMAVTDPDAERPHRRASLLLVPMDAPGVERVRNVAVMGEAGDGWASHAELRFTGVRVPATHLLGARGAGFAMAQERLGPGRIHHCVRWIGIAERALELLCAHAAHRAVAPGRMLGHEPAVQAMAAESRAEIDAARLLVLDVARRIDADGAAAARDGVSAIKFLVAGTLQRVLDRAIQVHGALGLTDETPLAWWWRHERGARIYDGPDEVHKAALGRRLMERHGLPREAHA